MLREAGAGAGAKPADLALKHGVSEVTLYNCNPKCGGLEVPEAKQMRRLEDANSRLKLVLADAMLGNAGLKDCCQKCRNAHC